MPSRIWCRQEVPGATIRASSAAARTGGKTDSSPIFIDTVVMVGRVPERAGHAAAARRQHVHRPARHSPKSGGGGFHSPQRLLVTMPVQDDARPRGRGFPHRRLDRVVVPTPFDELLDRHRLGGQLPSRRGVGVSFSFSHSSRTALRHEGSSTMTASTRRIVDYRAQHRQRAVDRRGRLGRAGRLEIMGRPQHPASGRSTP